MSKKDWGVNDPEDTFWYNTRTGEVEEGPQSLGLSRVGPFATHEEAAHATRLLNERARKWNEEEEEDF